MLSFRQALSIANRNKERRNYPGRDDRRYRDAILGFHRRRVADPELPADLTAETFAGALVGLQERVPDTPAAWLFAIAQRKLKHKVHARAAILSRPEWARALRSGP